MPTLFTKTSRRNKRIEAIYLLKDKIKIKSAFSLGSLPPCRHVLRQPIQKANYCV